MLGGAGVQDRPILGTPWPGAGARGHLPSVATALLLHFYYSLEGAQYKSLILESPEVIATACKLHQIACSTVSTSLNYIETLLPYFIRI